MNTTCTFTERIEEALKGEPTMQFDLNTEYGMKVKGFLNGEYGKILCKMTNRKKSSQKLQIGYKVLDKQNLM